MCVNVAQEKNFEADVREKVGHSKLQFPTGDRCSWILGFDIRAERGCDDDRDAPEESVSSVDRQARLSMMLIIARLRLCGYQDEAKKLGA